MAKELSIPKTKLPKEKKKYKQIISKSLKGTGLDMMAIMCRIKGVGLVKFILGKGFGKEISKMGSQTVKESITATRRTKIREGFGKMAR